MTEAEWLAWPDPERMLGFLRGKASRRKLRLFACALARRFWARLDQEVSRQAVEVAERYAEGLATAGQLKTAWTAACLVFDSRGGMDAAGSAANCAYADAAHAAAGVTTQARMAGFPKGGVAAVLREVFGNPFRPVVLDPSWLTSDVALLTRAAYEDRHLPSGHLDAQRLYVLADALLDAGCPADADVLLHLRSGEGVHVRGCWALDLLLEREG